MNSDEQLTSHPLSPGFAKAAEPTAAGAIITDATGLTCGETTLTTQGEALPIYFAKPQRTDGPLPIVLVVQEIFGVHEYIRDVCRRLAQQGYLAIAPELYFRQGNPQQYHDIPTLMAELVSKVPDHQVLGDLDHSVHWAAQQGGDAARLAITGFCWGGRISWLYAAHNPQLKAAVAWYGKLVADKTLTSPRHPVDIAPALIAPVLGLYGGQDGSIGPEQVDAMRQALQASRVDTDIIVYADAGHAFHSDYRASYHDASAKDGWQRMLAWFARYGVVPFHR